MPSTTSTSATIIQLSAVSGGGPAKSTGKPTAADKQAPGRRGSRGGDLILGGGLALLLLAACLTWEVLSQRADAPRASAQSDRGFIQAVH